MRVYDLRIGDWFLHHGEKYIVVNRPMTSEVLTRVLCYTPEGMFRHPSSIGSGVEIEYLGSNIPEVFAHGESTVHLRS